MAATCSLPARKGVASFVRLRLERRAGADQHPRRRLGDAAELYRQAAHHPVGPPTRKARCRQTGRCRSRRALVTVRSSGGTLDVVQAAASASRQQASRPPRAPMNGTSRSRRRYRACPRAVASRSGSSPRRRIARQPSRSPRIRTPGPWLAATVIQDRGRLRRHRSPSEFAARTTDGADQAAPRPLFEAPDLGSCCRMRDPQRCRPDGEGSTEILTPAPR